MGTLDRIKQHPMVATFTAATALYGVVAAIFLHLDSQYKEVQDLRIIEYSEQISRLDEFRDKFYEEEKLRRVYELDNIRLNNEVKGLVLEIEEYKAENWEDRYSAERINRIAAEEELSLILKRYNVEIDTIKGERNDLLDKISTLNAQIQSKPSAEASNVKDTLSAFDDLLKVKSQLTAQLAQVESKLREKEIEVQSLRDQVLLLKKKNEQLSGLIKTSGADSSMATKASIDALVASLEGVGDDYYVAQIVVNGVKNLGGNITGADFVRILNAANISDDYYCSQVIVLCSSRIIKPIGRDDVTSILSSISNDYQRALASAALTR